MPARCCIRRILYTALYTKIYLTQKSFGGRLMIKQVYKTICDTNDKIIMTAQPIESFVFFIKGGESTTIPLKITKKNREKISGEIKSAAVKKGVDGYILVLDMTSTLLKKGYKNIPEGDCCLRILYTPDEKITEIVWYGGGKIIDRECIGGRGVILDIWDAWC